MGDQEPPDGAGGSSSWAATVGNVGSQLARGVAGNPALAVIALILLIFTAAAALVAMQTGSGTLGLGALALLALAALAVVFFVVRTQTPGGRRQPDGSTGTVPRDERLTARPTGPTTAGVASDYGANLDALDAKRVGNIRSWLSQSAGVVANSLDVPAQNVRACIYVHDASHNQLRIVPALTHHIDGDSDEMTLTMPVGVGAAGHCFQAQRITVAKFKEDWGRYTIPESEFSKIDPDLRWIIAVPVLPKQKTVMVFNVDGLEDSPSEEQLKAAARTLFGWATLIHRETEASAW